MITGGDFRVLGPVEVVARGQPLRFARRQQLDLLAFLLLRADRTVTIDEIVEAMWGGAPPRTATQQIQNMVSTLRAALRGDGAPLARVDRQAAGYLLHITSGRLDLAEFTRLLDQARAAHPPAAAGLLREALALWRTPVPLAGARAPYATAARAYLTERRDQALEQLFDAELSCGNHALIVPELTDAVAADPLRQRLVAQLMLALHRSGRVTDALDVYRAARRALSEGFGLDAGVELRDLERRILRADRTLDPPADHGQAGAVTPGTPPRRAHPPAAVVPAQLPLDVRSFTGRGVELAHLDALTEPADPTVIIGTAGVGKTALAVHWAHRAAHRFPDGQLYVNLRGFHPAARPMPPAEALRGFLDALGVAPERVPSGLDAQAALYRSVIAGRRMLVLLDNALDAEQVRPLLPGGRGPVTLITSRDQLLDLIAWEGVHPLTLEVLPHDQAHDLLAARLGPQRIAADTAAADQITTLCARLPLALAMVAARAAVPPHRPLAALAAELAAARRREPVSTADTITADVQAAFSWSYRRLTPTAAALFRALGLHPGPDLSVEAAASLAGTTPEKTRPALAELLRAHMVSEFAPGRFTLHDLLREYAAQLTEQADGARDRRAALRRALAHYLHSAYHAAVVIYPHRHRLSLMPVEPGTTVTRPGDSGQASAWFAREHAALLAATAAAAYQDLGVYAWQLASALSTYLDRGGHWHDWAATWRIALQAAERTADRTGQAHAHSGLGLAHNRLGRYPRAHYHLRRADDLFEQLDDQVGQAYTKLRMSLVHEGRGDRPAALAAAQQALSLFHTARHRIGQGQALNSVGWLHAQLGRHADAIEHCELAVDAHRELADQEGLANALDSLGFAHHSRGDHRQAMVHYRQALVVLRELADPYYETITLAHLGDAHHAAGEHEAAAGAWRQALVLLEELGHPDAVDLRARLARLSP
ncbi:AfsR/SARP family transcriptional regulator [Dactylosporangium sp. CA-152071]|uniref:AfsR/SARP family transcriptional regulator n=1 Tax=Dactylosporangium sp. CA-152071 TaxID=3239933 RepID=UPI003D8D5F89